MQTEQRSRGHVTLGLSFPTHVPVCTMVGRTVPTVKLEDARRGEEARARYK